MLIVVTGCNQIKVVIINAGNANNLGGRTNAAEYAELFGPANQPLNGWMAMQ